MKTPTNLKAFAKQFLTFYLSARKYYVYSGKLSVDKDWESAGGLFMISGDWMLPKFDISAFPLVNKFTRGKLHCTFTSFSYHILLCFFLMNCLTFKILLFSVIPLAANANLSQECIDALLDIGVYNFDSSKARDLDSICTTKAMKCLVGYALRPSFLDHAFAAAIRLAKEKILQLQFSVNEQLNIATKNNVDFDVSRTLEGIRCIELQDLINRLQEEARARNKSKVPEQTSHRDKGKGKKLVDSLPPPISEEEEQDITPLIIKRKRLSLTSRAKSSFTLQVSSAPNIVAALLKSTLKSGPTPSPNEDDHLTIKMLKVQHSQGSGLQVQTPAQPSTLIQPTVPASSPTVNEEQDLRGLKTNFLSKLSSSSAQTTTIPSSPRPVQLEQPIVE